MYAPMLQDPLFGPAASALGFGAIAFSIVLLLITIWMLVWKALALWHAARNKQRWWFLALLIVNTVGILEIIYLAWFRKDVNDGKKELLPFVKDIEEKVAGASSPATGDTEEKDKKETE
ncbi:MAG: DUF5652 family protein [Minisyncoccia bacterium]